MVDWGGVKRLLALAKGEGRTSADLVVFMILLTLPIFFWSVDLLLSELCEITLL